MTKFTSCCPVWVKFVETFYPELIPNLYPEYNSKNYMLNNILENENI
ncbi:[Fe-Fe] hydrogenase large subunit C-terminal domain-containing protein [Clostridioides sp. ES-W-0017-02]